jgi:serine O-acetyltransferase
MDFGWGAKVGPGFVIYHGWGFVTGPGVTIGENVTVFHGVTIGQKHKISDTGRVKSFPIVEDEVWIGPHAVIAGGVVIGRGSRIAPGTVVTDDVEPYSIVGGNPMRVLRTDALPDVVNPAKVFA